MDDFEVPQLIKSDTAAVTRINRTPFLVGRGIFCDYKLPDSTMSRQHCKFEKSGKDWFLVDTSTNGTYLNGLLIKWRTSPPLKDGDIIRLCKLQDFTYTFRISVRKKKTDKQSCMRAGSVLKGTEVVTSNEPGPSTSAVRTERKHTLEMESSVDTRELPEKRIKISTLPSPNTEMLIAGSVIDLTEEESVEELDESFQDLPSDIKKAIQEAASLEKGLSETAKSGTPQPSTSTNKEVKTDEKCEEVNDMNDMDEDLLCSICSEMFVKATTLNCSHSFCKMCIEKWRTQQSVCPICRSKITSLNPTIVIDKLIDAFVQKSSTSFQESRKKLTDQRKELDKATNSKSSAQPTPDFPNRNLPAAILHLIYADSDSDSSDSSLDTDEGWQDDLFIE